VQIGAGTGAGLGIIVHRSDMERLENRTLKKAEFVIHALRYRAAVRRARVKLVRWSTDPPKFYV
jgi:hypothetical protein